MLSTLESKKGFTLLEIIIVMMLVGIIGAIAGIGYSRVVEGMIFTRENAETVQKGQIAMTKLVREFNNISSVSAGASNTSITFTSIKNGQPGERTVTFIDTDDTVIFNEESSNDILVDQVNNFELRYYKINSDTDQGTWEASSRVIEISLALQGANEAVSTFTARVRPRNFERR